MAEFALKLALFLIFALILITLSITDIKEKLIYPRYLLALFVTSLPLFLIENSIGISSRIVGALLISLPMLVLIFINENSFGGGDLKLFFLLGFILGVSGIIYLAIISFMLAGLFAAGLLFLKRRKAKEPIAFGPFISIGFLLSYMNTYF
jgi:leader peptidase (prepilin peptidase)/N-methyltransferase